MFSDAMNNILPTDWLDPYGRMPMAQGMPASVDITIVETDDGIKASSVKNPPQAGPSRMMQAIKEALGLDFCGQQCTKNNEPEEDEEQKKPTPHENTESEHKDRDHLSQSQDEDASQNHA